MVILETNPSFLFKRNVRVFENFSSHSDLQFDANMEE